MPMRDLKLMTIEINNMVSENRKQEAKIIEIMNLPLLYLVQRLLNTSAGIKVYT